MAMAGLKMAVVSDGVAVKACQDLATLVFPYIVSLNLPPELYGHHGAYCF